MKISENTAKRIVGFLSLAGAALFLWQTIPLLTEVMINLENILLGTYTPPQISKNVYWGFVTFASLIGILDSTFPSKPSHDDNE